MRVERVSYARGGTCAQGDVAFRLLLTFAALLLVARTASAVPVTFTLNSSQSNITLDVKNAQLFGTTLTIAEQQTGSFKAKYSGPIVTDIDGSSIDFPGGSNAAAGIFTQKVFIFDTPVPLNPGVGGTGAADNANYGVKLSADVITAIPPIDLTALNIPGITTLNLGTFQQVVLNTALRDLAIDVTSTGSIPRIGTHASNTFDASQVSFSLTGNADISLASVLRSPDYLSFGANAAALTIISGLINQQVPNLLNVSLPNPLAVFGIAPFDISVGFGTRFPLSGVSVPNEDATKLGTLQVTGTQYRLTIPASFDAIPDFSTLGAASAIFGALVPLNLGLFGQFQGNAPLVAIPEPGSIVLLGIGISMFLVCIKHRRGGLPR